jgi:hypothetical protein
MMLVYADDLIIACQGHDQGDQGQARRTFRDEAPRPLTLLPGPPGGARPCPAPPLPVPGVPLP